MPAAAVPAPIAGAGLAPADRASFAGAFAYSITSSAMASRLGDTVRPSVFVSSNLTGVWTGSLLGFALRRMRSILGCHASRNGAFARPRSG
jgi:hypothetical protein